MIHYSVPHLPELLTLVEGRTLGEHYFKSICLIISSNVSYREATSCMVHLTAATRVSCYNLMRFTRSSCLAV